MIMLLNPGTKKRKRRKYSSRLKRRYGRSRRRVHGRRRRRMSVKVRRAAARRRKYGVIRGFICRKPRNQYQAYGDLKRYCAPKRRGKRKGRKARAASGVAEAFKATPAAGGALSFAFNSGRRRKGRNYSHWIPAYRNPGLTASVAAPFNTKLLMSTIPFVSGFMLNGYTAGFIASPGFVPTFFKSGGGSYIIGLLSAGLTASAIGLISPSSAGVALLGSVSQVAVRIFRDQILPMFPGVAMALTGIGDYLTVGDAKRARRLHGMSDYLTVGDARRARRLHGLGEDDNEMSGLSADYTDTTGMLGDGEKPALPFNVDLGDRPFGDTEERPFGDNMGAVAPVAVACGDSPFGDEVDSQVLAYEG